MCIFSSEEGEKPALPSLAKSNHPKISNGSVLIQLNYSESQGRYLEVRLRQLINYQAIEKLAQCIAVAWPKSFIHVC